jgi:hypothetical protein
MAPENLPDAFADDPVSSGEAYYEGDHTYGYPGCETCDDAYCMEDGHSSNDGWFGCNDGQFFVFADYLYVRAHFSEATAFVEQDISQANIVEIDFHQLDFDYESSYRIGGGWRRCCCGDEIRFLYTRLTSSAEEEVPFDTDIFIPLEPGTPPGGRTEIDADVDVRSFDLECAKTIPLGAKCCGCGDACGGCGDACGGCGSGCGGCGDCCMPQCPVWDVTWSGGIRAAEASWSRSYTAFDQADAFVGEGESSMDFEGVGARVGLEGRRYFFKNGWLSTYMKGNLSLLVGDVEIETVRTIEGGTAPDNILEQSFDGSNVIPVTELEAGITGQVTCHSRISAGYLLSAWHDLGFRDQFDTANVDTFPLRYDDANILGFDGFFARVEFAY